MNKIIYLILIVFTTGFLASCEKEDNNPVIDTNDVTAPALTLGFEELVLLEDNAEDTITFEWSPAQYSLNNITEPTYRLQFKHADSSDFRQLTSTRETYFKISVAELNSSIKKAGLEPAVAADIEMRVNAELVANAESTKVSSEIVQASVTAYEPAGPPPNETAVLYVPGDYQGWAPADAPNVYSPEDNGVYQGYIYYPPGGSFEFKFTSAPDWDHTNFGSGGDGVLDTDPGAGNLTVPESGTYYHTVDTVNLTWSTEVRNFALVGSFTAWGDDPDIPLEFDADEQVFTVTRDFEAEDEFKWRANADWAVNLGINDPDDGTLVQDGGNIVIEEAGNYTVKLNLYNEVPTYELIKN